MSTKMSKSVELLLKRWLQLRFDFESTQSTSQATLEAIRLRRDFEAAQRRDFSYRRHLVTSRWVTSLQIGEWLVMSLAVPKRRAEVHSC